MTEIALDMVKMHWMWQISTTSNAFSIRKLSGSTQTTPRKGLCFVCCIHRNTPHFVSPATVFPPHLMQNDIRYGLTTTSNATRMTATKGDRCKLF